MGASIGTETSGKSRDVDLNIIPFIDLLSCLTAFLLVTAVWTNLSQLDAKPSTRGGEPDVDPAPVLSVMVDSEAIWVGVSRVGELERIARTSSGHDWAALETALKAHKTSSLFSSTDAIEVAANSTETSPIAYQQLVLAMDVAVKAGFADVSVLDPRSLSTRPM